MESTLEYMARKHETLNPNYTTADGRYLESCGHVAFEVAKRLLNEGKSPEIVTFTEDLLGWPILSFKPLVPKTYEGRITWYAHHVCVADGIAYDPIIGEPVLLSEYCQRAFDEEIKMQISFPPEKVVEIIGRERQI